MAKKSKLQKARHFQGLLNMLARFPGEAVVSGRSASRVYETPSGAWDAEIVDHVFSEVQRFLDEEGLSQGEIAHLLWNRSGFNWAVGNYDQAEFDVERSMKIYEATADGARVLPRMRRTLDLIRSRRSPLDLLDD